MGRNTGKTTSLWSVIEGMQVRLEALGLEREVVDAAVARGLESLLESDDAADGADAPDRKDGLRPLFFPALASA